MLKFTKGVTHSNNCSMIQVVIILGLFWGVSCGSTEIAKQHEFSSVVIIFGKTGPPFCAGILINNDTVLTSKQCRLLSMTDTWFVVAGINKFSSVRDTPGRQFRLVKAKISYPPAPNKPKDLLVLKLKIPIKESHTISYARIPEAKAVPPFNTHDCVYVGWGSPDDGAIYSDEQRKIRMEAFPNYFDDPTSGYFAGVAKKFYPAGVCKAAQGGPLQCAASDGGKPYQVGVLSGGDGVCNYGTIGITFFTNMSYFRNWRHLKRANWS